LVIAEADRFPAVGRTFYAEGPQRVAVGLAEAFTALASRGRLRLGDEDDAAELAAYHFCWLVLSIPWNRVLLAGSGELPGDAEIDRVVRAGVTAFLGAYATPRGRRNNLSPNPSKRSGGRVAGRA
jgi:TetR/AcrR family transcriptional repressor of mexJK operon